MYTNAPSRPSARLREKPKATPVGLLNLLDAAKTLGGKFVKAADMAVTDGPQMDPRELWNDYQVYKDPTGSWILDVGPLAPVGKPLKSYPSTTHLQNQGESLRDYLSGTELGETLGPRLDNYRVGYAPTLGDGFNAGVSPPETSMLGKLYPGFLAVGSHLKGQDGTWPLMEHELQHILQNVTDAPVGTGDGATKEIAYLRAIGQLPDDFSKRVAQAATVNKKDTEFQRYLQSFGEVEARLAADRLDPAKAAKRPDAFDYATAGGRWTDLGAWWKFRESQTPDMRYWWNTEGKSKKW